MSKYSFVINLEIKKLNFIVSLNAQTIKPTIKQHKTAAS
jgi:hypothetical protein